MRANYILFQQMYSKNEEEWNTSIFEFLTIFLRCSGSQSSLFSQARYVTGKFFENLLEMKVIWESSNSFSCQLISPSLTINVTPNLECVSLLSLFSV